MSIKRIELPNQTKRKGDTIMSTETANLELLEIEIEEMEEVIAPGIALSEVR
jgi:hypothetical protein